MKISICYFLYLTLLRFQKTHPCGVGGCWDFEQIVVLAERAIPEEGAQCHLQGGAGDEHQRTPIWLRQCFARFFAARAGQRRIVRWRFPPQDSQAAKEQRDAAQGVTRAIDQMPRGANAGLVERTVVTGTRQRPIKRVQEWTHLRQIDGLNNYFPRLCIRDNGCRRVDCRNYFLQNYLAISENTMFWKRPKSQTWTYFFIISWFFCHCQKAKNLHISHASKIFN